MQEKSGTPLYEQLYSFIKKDILSGNLRENERLPSKRRMAENLQVSVITVENAYANLLAEGYIYSKPKSGYYISPIEIPNPKPNPFPSFYHKPKLETDMRANRFDSSLFPFSLWSRLTRKVLSDCDATLFCAENFAGSSVLRQEIANYLSRNRSMRVSPENIIIGAGTEILCHSLVRLLGSFKVFGVENPCYRKVPRLYESEGARIFPLNLDYAGVKMEELTKSPVEVLHISPNHQYPTGIVTDAARRFDYLSWASEKKGRAIIEDDYDSELRFDSRPLPSLYSDDSGGNIIYMNTFSKTISPSLRIGFLVLPDGLMEEYSRKFQDFSCTVSTIDQLVLAEFLKSGQYERHISRLRKFYRQRREKFFEEIKKRPLSSQLEIIEGRAGLHFLLKLQTEKSDEEIKSLAAKEGIGLSFLSDHFSPKFSGFSHQLLVNYSGFDEKNFAVVLEFLSNQI